MMEKTELCKELVGIRGQVREVHGKLDKIEDLFMEYLYSDNNHTDAYLIKELITTIDTAGTALDGISAYTDNIWNKC